MEQEWKERIEPEIREAIDSDPLRKELRGKMISFGGEEALVRPSDIPENEVERLLERGKFWLGNKADFNRMQAINCHRNSVCLMKEGLGEVVNGYALTQDGMWRNHSWGSCARGRLP